MERGKPYAACARAQDEAQVHVIGGKASGSEEFSTFEIIFEKQHQKLDLISGRIVISDPSTYVDVHTEAVSRPDNVKVGVPPALFDGTHPCVVARVRNGTVSEELGRCVTPAPSKGSIDQFEVDLRYGAFILRQTDLSLEDGFDVPLTRSYNSRDWVSPNRVHAFGRNSNHPYDIAPLGTRNPYTYMLLTLEDGDFVYFDRISSGTGYADAVYQHSETSTRFYGATIRWNGAGWTLTFADGSAVLFPESYNAKNLAQGAPIEIRNAAGAKLELQRDGQRNLQEIRTPNGHWIRLAYDDRARITQAEDDSGKWVKYEYGSDGYGMLLSVIQSSGHERHYQYIGDLMTTISDEHQQVLLQNTYDSGTLVDQKYANGVEYKYRYRWNSSRKFVDSVVLTMPDGSEREVQTADSVPVFLKR